MSTGNDKWYAANILFATYGPASTATQIIHVGNDATKIREKAAEDIKKYAGAIGEVVIGTVTADTIEEAVAEVECGQWVNTGGISHLVDSKIIQTKRQYLRIYREGI